MATWKCIVCGSNVSGPELDHGTYHGQCKVCGQGYGACETDYDLQERWMKSQEPTYKIVIEYKGEVKETVRQGYEYGNPESYRRYDPGTLVTIYDNGTGKALDRFRVCEHCEIWRNATDKKFKEEAA